MSAVLFYLQFFTIYGFLLVALMQISTLPSPLPTLQLRHVFLMQLDWFKGFVSYMFLT